VAALRQLLLERVSDDVLAAIVDKLIDMAKEGDVAAARLVLSYTVGKPTAAVDPDRLDIEEFNLFCEEALNPISAAQPLRGVPVEVACTMAHAAVPTIAAATGKSLSAALFAYDAQLAEEQEEDEEEEESSGQFEPMAGKDAAVPHKAERQPSQKGKEKGQSEEAMPVPPSLQEILGYYYSARDTLRAAKAAQRQSDETAPAPSQPATDSKPVKTAHRAANQGP
jgi:hypothetical protein